MKHNTYYGVMFNRTFVKRVLLLGLLLHPTLAWSLSPRAAFVFDTGERVLTEGQGYSAEVKTEESAPWVEAEVGTAIALREEADRIEFSPEVFSRSQGAVRIALRPDEVSANAQYLFRVYHPKGDGLTLYLKEGGLLLRYFNRASGESLGTRLPATACPAGEWSTLLVSWSFDGAAERQIVLRSGEKARAVLKLPETLPLSFHPESRVLAGNEHAGGAAFYGAFRSVEFFDTPVEQDALSAKKKADIPKASRERVLPETLFFSRSQPKYDLHTNTLLRRWVDRPLFFDRRTESSIKPYVIVSSESFFKEQETVRAYGLDGFGSLLGWQPFQGTAFFEMLDYAESEPERCVPLVLEAGPVEDAAMLETRLQNFLPVAQRAVTSSQVLKVDGKVLVLTYAVDSSPLEYWERFRNTLREQVGDKFLFVADTTVWRPRLLKEFHELGGISEETLARFQRHLRSWLDATDGLMWAGGNHTNRPDGTLSREFYSEFLLPVFAGILNEPAYKGKLLGLDAEVGYVNVMTSRRINWEEGTRRLRDGFALAQEVNPDFITMPEWNELNENTSIQPTLTNSLTTQRIVRAMKERFGGKVPPLPDPEGAPPNLVVSFRPYVKIGEKASVEVLNIPDPGQNGQKGEILVELAFRGSAGGIVKTFPKIALAADQLVDHHFEFASEELATEAFVAPVLTVTTPEGKVTQWEEGLESMRLMPTWNLNYKETKISLRDLLQPKQVEFSLEKQEAPGGGVTARGTVQCDEPLVSVEVVQDAAELYAVSNERELSPTGNEILVLLQWQAMRNPRDFNGEVGMDGGSWRKFRQWGRPEYKREEYRLYEEKGAGRVRFETGPGVNATNARGGFFVIPDWEKASLWVKAPGREAIFPLAEVVAQGAMARVLPGGLTVEAHHLQRLPEVPYPLMKKEVEFQAVVHPQSDAPLQMRVVTASGKIYRSPLKALEGSKHSARGAEAQRELAVWSATHGKPVSLSIPGNRLPALQARLTPDMGAFIKVSEQKTPFQAYAGGVPFDMGAFAKRHLVSAYPAFTNETAPTWAQEGEERLLRFDGKGNFLYFTEESLPRGSFTLEFEIKPTATRPTLLCTQRGYARGALTLKIIEGELQGEWIDGAGKLSPFRTGLRLPEHAWSKVTLSHDFEALRFTVNGGHYTFPVENGMSAALTPFIFGGYGTGKALSYFEGFLRSLSIRHYTLDSSH